MGFIIGLLVGGAVVTGLSYIAQQHDQSRFPDWLVRIATPWMFYQ